MKYQTLLCSFLWTILAGGALATEDEIPLENEWGMTFEYLEPFDLPDDLSEETRAALEKFDESVEKYTAKLIEKRNAVEVEEGGLTQDEIDRIKIVNNGTSQDYLHCDPSAKFWINLDALKKIKQLTPDQNKKLRYLKDSDIVFQSERGMTFSSPKYYQHVLSLHFFGSPRSQIARILELDADIIDRMFVFLEATERFRLEELERESSKNPAWH